MKKFSSTVRGNLRRTSQTKNTIRLIGVGAVLLLLLFFVPRLFAFLSSIVVTPVVVIETWLAESDTTIPAYLRDRSRLIDRIEDLERQLADEGHVTDAEEELRLENADLRKTLGADGETRIGAAVIGRPTALPYDVIVLDKGTADGVVENAPVYVGQEQVIGFVAAAFAHTAVVTLATTPGFSSTVYIYGPDIYTTAEGVGAGTLRVNVPQGIQLSEGDLVVLPTFATGIYGSISVVESVPTKPEQYGYVSTDTPLSSLRFVSVSTKPLTEMSFDEAKAVVERVRKNILTVPVPSGVLIDSSVGIIGSSTASTTASTTNESI